jgi:hypothetical protein
MKKIGTLSMLCCIATLATSLSLNAAEKNQKKQLVSSDFYSSKKYDLCEEMICCLGGAALSFKQVAQLPSAPPLADDHAFAQALQPCAWGIMGALCCFGIKEVLEKLICAPEHEE